MKTAKEIREALRNNCFNVYIKAAIAQGKDSIVLRVADAKETKDGLVVRVSRSDKRAWLPVTPLDVIYQQ